VRARIDLVQASLTGTAGYSAGTVASMLGEPVVIVSAPRSGSTLLFELLMRTRGAWTIGGESHAVFNGFPHLRAENAAFDSGSLGEAQADPVTCERTRACFLFLLRDHTGARYLDREPGARPPVVQLVEKTPRNALNIPFLLRVFPNARFLYLHRDPRPTVASLIEAWTIGLRTGRFSTFPDLPGWDRRTWCFLLPPGWRAMKGRSLAEIAAFQWSASNEIILDNLQGLAPERWMALAYESLVRDPAGALRRVAGFAGFDPAGLPMLELPLPLSRTTLTPPDDHKWKQHEAAIEPLLPALQRLADRIKSSCTRPF
jgi:hypothetical protein